MGVPEKVVIGTRGSQLALWQANHVADLLRKAWEGLEVEVMVIKTKGDKILNVALSKIGDKGLFTKEIEDALIAGDIDMCVHSMKDVPTKLAPEFRLAAMTRREDPRDVFICPEGVGFFDLPAGAKVATGSLRRVAQLQALRPDVELCGIRGNVPTRIGKAEDGTFDAVVLAASGVKRLELDYKITHAFSEEDMIPAVGQGAVGIEIRNGDQQIESLLEAIADADTMRDVAAERVVMESLDGGCQVPIGAYARELEDGAYRVDGFVASLDGSKMIRAHATGDVCDSKSLAAQVVDSLCAQGARELLEAIR